MKPKMRAVVTQDVIALLSEDQKTALRDLAPDTYDQIVNARALDFIPLELDMEISRKLWASLGKKTCLGMMRTGTGATMHHPIARPLVKGALRFFGIGPAALLKTYSKTARVIMRNVGKFKAVSVNDHSVDLEWTEVPSSVFSSGIWVDAFAASFESVFDYCNVKGTGQALFLDKISQSLTLRFDWAEI